MGMETKDIAPTGQREFTSSVPTVQYNNSAS